jgi:hypothetical protein
MIRRTVSLSLSLVVAMAIGIGFAFPAQAVPTIGYSPNAYATFVKGLGGTLTSGPTANTGLCVSITPKSNSNTVASLNVLNGLLTSGTATSMSTAKLQGGVPQSKGTDTIQSLTLGTLLDADLITATATASGTQGNFSVSGTTQFVGLDILGIPQLPNPPPNTVVPLLPAVGLQIVLNQQTSTVAANLATITVNAIHITVSDQINVLGLGLGTQITIGHGTGAMRNLAGAPIGGRAYGTQVTLGTGGLGVASGPTALVTIGCFGSNNQLVTNDVAGVNLPPFFVTGAVHSEGRAQVASPLSSADLLNETAGVDLLGGLVTADLVHAEAHGTTDGTTKTFSDTGSLFVNLVVNGQAVVDPAANTRININLPTISATVWLHRVIQTASSIEVRMIDITVKANTLGIATGTTIRVAVASVSTP